MNVSRSQRGLSFISVMVMMILFGFVALFVIKLVPVYIENFNIRSALDSFRTDPGGYTSQMDVQTALAKRFSINDIRSVEPSDVLVEPDGKDFALTLEYEARVPFVSNVSLVVKFTENAEARGLRDAP
jgi:hypothetical protein